MSKGRVDLKPQGASQRRLSIIYFIDSAKTRSFSIPLGRLNVLLALIFLIFSWSIASIFVIGWLGQEQLALSARLRASLATIFDYQSRFDNVYELAYPPASHTQDIGLDPAPSGLRAEDYAEHMPADLSHSAAPAASAVSEVAAASASSTPTASPAPVPQGAPASVPSADHAAASQTTASSSAPAATAPPPAAAPAKSAEAPDSRSTAVAEVPVTVGNAVLEKAPNGVSLHFELANRSSRTRAEGYIWAVAEFVGDDGQKYFIGSPRELKLNSNGEPSNPEKATYFGIKRFKKQSFQFPVLKGRSGTFTAVRIGIMDLSGEGRRLYRLSTEVRVR
jgi:hypothetical protein